MRALPSRDVCRALLVTLALTALVPAASIATARTAWAQEIGPPPGEDPKKFEDADVERLFREYQRLTRALERRQARPSPRIDRKNRPQGDFWMPGEFERTFGR
jgi:hypothetical protein